MKENFTELQSIIRSGELKVKKRASFREAAVLRRLNLCKREGGRPNDEHDNEQEFNTLVLMNDVCVIPNRSLLNQPSRSTTTLRSDFIDASAARTNRSPSSTIAIDASATNANDTSSDTLAANDLTSSAYGVMNLSGRHLSGGDRLLSRQWR